MPSLLPSPPVRRPDAARELLRRRQARRELLAFSTYTKPDYEVNWHHAAVCRALDRFLAGDMRRLMIFQPPQTGKSELVSRRLPAFALGQNPDCRVIACSHTAEFASGLNRDVQRIIDDEPYRRLFPETQLFGKASRSASEHAYLRNSEMFEIVGGRGYYKSAGVGGSIFGRGFDLGIVDDPFRNREAADSPAQRESVWKWFTGDFMSRAGKDARILITHTRFHPEDLAGRLLDLQQADPNADKWEVVCFPALSEGPGHPDDPRKPGEALWPNRKTIADLAAIKAANPYEWDSQYQQRPRPSGGTEWPDEYFGPGIWFDEWPAQFRAKAMALDPSKGKSDKWGDYRAYIWGGCTSDGMLWVDADLAREPTPAMVEFGINLWRKWQPQGFAIETNAWQELIGVEFIRLCRERQLGVMPIFGLTNTIAKNVRIRTLGPLLAQGRIRFKASAGARLLVRQLRDFPNGEHDDAPDALEFLTRMLLHLLGKKQEHGPQLLKG